MHGLFEQRSAASSQGSPQHDQVTGRNSLVDLCRSIIVTNLERYPPEALGILDKHEWDSIVRVRYERTKPIKGKGGLDGKGRVNPAICEKFMLELENSVPILASSHTADNLVWKDIVEFKFRTGGVSRPCWLLYPWPVLQDLVTEYRNTLARILSMEELDGDTRELCIRTINGISELPMDVSLLKSSGIGKVVTKFLRACSSGTCRKALIDTDATPSSSDTPRNKLEGTLTAWKEMAAQSGIQINDFAVDASMDTRHSSLSRTRTCMSWRELLSALQNYDTERRSNQGARMRERRRTLDRVRPKIVKVRHASLRQNEILNREATSTNPSAAKQKIQRLRMEASVSTMRRSGTVARAPLPVSSMIMKKTPVGFGAAVAIATGQQGKAIDRCARQYTRTASVQLLPGNKQLKIPNDKKAAINLQRMSK